MLSIGLALLIAGCGSTDPTSDSVLASMDHQSYTKPTALGATITNNSSDKLFTNHCLLFQRLDGDTWVDVPPESVCTAVRAEIRAGGTGGAAGFLSVQAQAGQYRGVTSVETEGGDTLTLVTDAFTLQ
jgi:hypothetical protein